MFKKRLKDPIRMFSDVITEEEIPCLENEYLCVRTVSMRHTKRAVYTEGKIYYCESSGCITDNHGNMHQRIPNDILKKLFKVRSIKSNINKLNNRK